MKLPKLYRPVKIKFWSLRNVLGDGYGVIHDADTEVERMAQRVRTRFGWKWQIKDFNSLSQLDWFVETDQEMLNETAYQRIYDEIVILS